MTEKTKGNPAALRTRRRLIIGLVTLLILIFLAGLGLSSTMAQSDPTGRLYYGYTIDPTTDAHYRVDLETGGGDYKPWPLPRETTVGYEAPPLPRPITRELAWRQATGNYYELVIQDAATDMLQHSLGNFHINYYDYPLPNAQYSPDGQQVVFSAYNEPRDMSDPEPRDQDLWLVQLETGDLKRLTENEYDDRLPTFMPDGKSILYLSQQYGPYNFYEMDLASGMFGFRVLDQGLIYSYEWSPDGTQILYLSDPPAMTPTEVAVEKRGTRYLMLWNPATGNERVLEYGGIYDFFWSPDSQWIAFAMYDPMETLEERSYGGIMGVSGTPFYEEQPSSLWIIRPDGTDKQIMGGSRMRLHSFDWIP